MADGFVRAVEGPACEEAVGTMPSRRLGRPGEGMDGATMVVVVVAVVVAVERSDCRYDREIAAIDRGRGVVFSWI